LGSNRRTKSRIPVGSQFTPKLTNLGTFLDAIVRLSGDKEAMASAIWKPSVRKDGKKNPTPRNRLLPLEAAKQYGLLTGKYQATGLAIQLSNLGDHDRKQAFAKHILLELGGLRVVQGIQDMAHQGKKITSDALARHLTAQGFVVGEHNTQINSLRLWLAEAGVFPDPRRPWHVDQPTVDQLVGLREEQIAQIAQLEPQQIAFVEAICAIGSRSEYVAADVRTLAQALRPHVNFDRGSLPKNVLQPLQVAGLIKYTTKGTKGGKSATFSLQPAFDAAVLQPFLTSALKDLDPVVATYFRKAPSDIYRDLRATTTSVKGRALEALAIRLMRLLGLKFINWNVRAADTTGRAEVDAVFAGVLGVVPTRWQVQCKNTPKKGTPLEDVAKEVGLVPITNATHLLFLTNGFFTREARQYAAEVMKRTALSLFLLDQSDFSQLVCDDTSLARILRNQAEDIMRTQSTGSLFAS
jgi:site-specific DNA-methyltransferase (cytosine-N4-specific)